MEKAIEKAKEAYRLAQKNADNKTCELLEGIFGADTLRPKDVKDRIKTFEDAVNELGNEHKFVNDWTVLSDPFLSPDIKAYLKLRIIVAALNEGWQPSFTKDEDRYYPLFYLYTQDEIDEMSDEEKKQLCSFVFDESSSTNCSLGCSRSHRAFSSSSPGYCARLILKTRELAVYCGRQFLEIWKDFITI